MTNRTKGELEGEIVDGPEFLKLCPDCERKVRARAKAKAHLAEISGTPGMIGNVIVPDGKVSLILDVADVELEEAVGLAYLASRGR